MLYKQWEQAYAFLNEGMLKNPIELILSNATERSMYQDRHFLIDIFHAAITSGLFQDYEEDMMTEYVYLFTRFMWLLEASHRASELYEKKQLHYSYSGDVTPK
jgi:hypothetical protein